MIGDNFGLEGLTDEQVLASRAEHGKNEYHAQKESRILHALKGIAQEPMVILLLIASTIYFVSGEIGDGVFLSLAVILISIISLYQESRSQIALEKIKQFSQPKSNVIRNGIIVELLSADVVLGDLIVVEEGAIITADGKIIHSNDFSVNESLLTGESMPVSKNKGSENNFIYHGTPVSTGIVIAEVIAIGPQTQINRIGESLKSIQVEKTPLERQIYDFVKKMVIIGAIIFVFVWGINFFRSGVFLDSLLKSLTLAMSILPEEIPVAFTTFMAIGAWRLMKMGIVVKQMKTVETLGSATVICVDKTGTITENKMSVAQLYVHKGQLSAKLGEELNIDAKELIKFAMWSSEPIPFDPMEKAIHQAYEKIVESDERSNYKMIHEYPLGGKPPMMTHIFENNSGDRIIAAKGALEAFIKICPLSPEEIQAIEEASEQMASEGYRILGVAKSNFQGLDFPDEQQHFQFEFIGLIAFYDPPKQNIEKVFADFNRAGIDIKIITGDNALTTMAIANQVHFKNADQCMSGAELDELSEAELNKRVSSTSIFTRMFPEAKLKIINALKSNGEVVAMTGDGVNDGPALKAAHIGIAMGKRGTEIAKQAASLVIIQDDLSTMVDAIAMGRRINANLKKAIRYIISIHIPIILVVFIPLVLGWAYPNIFLPIHVILLELIMGPTCSIIYENEPMESNTMMEPPKAFKVSLFNQKEIFTSVIQGFVIAIGTLLMYQYSLGQTGGESTTRTMVFITLMSSNIFLTLVNRSFYESIVTTWKYKNNLVGLIISITIIISGMLLFVPIITDFFKFEQLSSLHLILCIATGFLSVIWYEVVKWWKRRVK